MPKTEISFEIPLNENEKPFNRGLVIDASVIYGHTKIDWAAEHIRSNVLKWADIDSGYLYNWPIVILDRNNTLDAWNGEAFDLAWHTLANQLSFEYPTQIHLMHHSDGSVEMFASFGPEAIDAFSTRSIVITVVTKEVFDLIETDDSLSEAEVLLSDLFLLGFDLDMHRNKKTAAIVEAFEKGHISVPTYLYDNGAHRLGEVVVLDTDNKGDVIGRCFEIPRSYDPAGHLP